MTEQTNQPGGFFSRPFGKAPSPVPTKTAETEKNRAPVKPKEKKVDLAGIRERRRQRQRETVKFCDFCGKITTQCSCGFSK